MVRRIHVAEALSYRMVPSAPLISLDAIQSAYLAWFAGLSPNPDPACAGHPLNLMAEAVELCIAFGATPAQIVAVTYDELDKSQRRNDGADPDAVAGELADVVMNAFNVARIRGIDVGHQRGRRRSVLRVQPRRDACAGRR